eukprot:29483-Pelagococcus_subviridis.AAC.2
MSRSRRRDLHPLPQQVRDHAREPPDVLHERVERERERVEVLRERRLPGRERHRLHVQHGTLRVIQNDKRDEEAAPRRHLSHLPPQRLLLVEPPVRDDDAQLLQRLVPPAQVLSRRRERRVQRAQ